MLRSEVKSILILTLFSYLMWDYLTIATIGFSSLGLLLIALNVKVPKNVRTIIALAVFASYWFKYGKVIDPEVGLNFLTSVVILKLLEKETLRDSYMIFFGLILLLSAGALFEKTLTYVIFFLSSFAILLFDFYGTLLIKSRGRDLAMGFLWVVPMTCVLFFAVPRILSPLPFRNSSPSAGEVGYTPNVRISEVESLEMSDEPAFQASLEKPLSPEKLYWRGNVLSQTDGWNWSTSYSGNLVFPAEKNPRQVPGTLLQKIRLFAKSEYYFGLDHVEKFYFGGNTVVPDDLHALSQSGDEWNPRYEVLSRTEGVATSELPGKKYLKVIQPKKIKDWINEKFPSTTVAGIRTDIQRHFQQEGFTYSLSPGKISNFSEFMLEKKIGFCSHYASATATILRTRGFPVRLVSGFMGGNYNSYADFYLVTQNDAHVWLEAWENGRWLRLDPTVWIVPERLTLGGEAFLGTIAVGSQNPLSRLKFNVKWLQEATKWFNQWDFKFYNWLEEMDYYGQEAILSKFKFKREWLYTFAPLFIAFFIGLYFWQTRRREEVYGMGPHELAWKEFFSKLSSRGLLLMPLSVKENEEKIANWVHPEKEKFHTVLRELVAGSFSESKRSDWSVIRKKIKKL